MRRLFSWLLLVGLLGAPTRGRAARTETQRLTTLARVWGFLKYHHPGIARPHLDWDSVLIASVPLVKAARTPQAFAQQLTQLLTLLGPLPVAPNALPANLQDRNVDVAWLQRDPALTPALRAALQQVLACHAFPAKNPYLTTTPFGVITHQEQSYPDPVLPPEAYRLLGLFRYWNIIQYYYPYKYAIGGDWKAILPHFIPRFQHATTPVAYHLLVLELVAQLHDTHGYVYGSPVLAAHLGEYYPPIELGYVDGHVRITRLYTKAVAGPLPVEVGAEVLKADGVPVKRILARNHRYVAASTAAAARRDGLRFILRGQAADSLVLTLQTSRGVQTVSLPRTLAIHSLTDASYKDYYFDRNWQDTSAIWRELPGQVGYVHLGSGGVKAEQIGPLMQRFHHLKGLILDLRTYPKSEVVNQLSSYLQAPGVPYATFTLPAVAYPGYSASPTIFSTPPSYHEPAANYSGKVVVLVSEKTQSYAELSAMLLQVVPGVVVLGSQTAGADGNVVQVPFPGGLVTYYSGLGVYYPNGRETQRVGIVPTHQVRPTTAGIKAGRDEVLDQALLYLTGQ
jgi:C-terminal processing protease CtpA/Prc